MSQEIRNLAKDLVTNQGLEVRGLATPEKFSFPKGLSEEEYFQLLVQRVSIYKRFLGPERRELPDIDLKGNKNKNYTEHPK